MAKPALLPDHRELVRLAGLALAAWATWHLRREWRTPRVLVPLVATLLGLLAIAWAGPQQDINTMAILPPLALLGAHGVGRLRRGAANMLDWFGVMTFGFFAFLIWLGYAAMLTGEPPKIAKYFAKTAPDFVARFDMLAFCAALALTLAWLYLAFFTAPSPTRGVARWAAGLALLWGTFATLWLPWADHIKSYRSVALEMRARLPANAGCIAARDWSPRRVALSFQPASDRTAARSAGESAQMRLPHRPGPSALRDRAGTSWRKLADVSGPATAATLPPCRYGPG